VDLRCKVVRAIDASELEEAVNQFLEEEVDADGEAQVEAITQSEGPGGITVTIWYSLVEEQGIEFTPVPEERLT
jgi:hypothetical protein